MLSPKLFLCCGVLNCSVQFNSVTQSCLTLCDPMNHSIPGLPVHHQLPESTQTHVHRAGDAIQPSHPLPSPSLSCVQLFATPWTVAHQAPLSMGTLQRRIPEWVAISYFRKGFPGGSDDKESTCHAYPGSIPGLERSPGEEYGYPRQYCCLENPWTEEPGRLRSVGLRESESNDMWDLVS